MKSFFIFRLSMIIQEQTKVLDAPCLPLNLQFDHLESKCRDAVVFQEPNAISMNFTAFFYLLCDIPVVYVTTRQYSEKESAIAWNALENAVAASASRKGSITDFSSSIPFPTAIKSGKGLWLFNCTSSERAVKGCLLIVWTPEFLILLYKELSQLT